MTKIFNCLKFKKLRQKLRKEMPRAEIIFWEKIRRRQINGLKFHRQYSIGKYVVDFYCPLAKLVIELDGDTHFNDEYKSKDLLRDKNLNNLGLSILRFNNNDIYYNLEGVIDVVYEKVKTPPNLPFVKGEEKIQ
jgi:very-short-patch-repair endonuclease